MKKRILLVASMVALLVCLFAISVSAETALKPQDTNAYGELSFFDESISVGRTNDKNGFTLVSDDGELVYEQGPLYTHSLNADYFWYEIGDVICIGDNEMSYYCFPKENVQVAKTRFAVEELYKINKQNI